MGDTDWAKEARDLANSGGGLFHDIKKNTKGLLGFYQGRLDSGHIVSIIIIWVFCFGFYIALRLAANYLGITASPKETRIGFLVVCVFMPFIASFVVGWEAFKLRCNTLRATR
jgi:hypothetical protein